MRYRGARRGVTLVELVVVVALLGLVAGVAGLTIHTAPPVPAADSVGAQVAVARGRALESGQSVTVDALVGRRRYTVTALPDGSVIADSGVRVDRLTGQVIRAPR